MKTITIEVPDEVYQACEEMARQQGRPVEALVLEFVLEHRFKPQPQPVEDERKAAWERLMRHMGAQNLGYPTGADNESIDADLVREYGRSHEEDNRC